MLVELEDELFERTVRYDRVIRIADGSPREKKGPASFAAACAVDTLLVRLNGPRPGGLGSVTHACMTREEPCAVAVGPSSVATST